MNKIELKSCPFCGDEADIYVGNGVMVVCKNCGCYTPHLEDACALINRYKNNIIYEIIENWNMRYEKHG